MKFTHILAATTALTVMAAPAFAETRTYDVGSFEGIDVSTGIEVFFETGPVQKVEVENEKGDFSEIEVKVDDDFLVLKRPSKLRLGFGKRAQNYIVHVTAPTLSELEVSSGARAEGSGLSGDVEIDISSGAYANVSEISAGDLEVEASSGSQVLLSGTCTEIDADASSGASIEASGLVCANFIGDVSSGASIQAHASASVDGDASSGGSILVEGGATNVSSDKSSGGSVRVVE